MSFIYFLMTPHPTQERIHLQKATAESPLCTRSWPGASNCRLPSRSPSPAVLGLIPATQETKEKVWTRSENCLTHQAAQTRAGACISFFTAALVSVVPWPGGISHTGPVEVVAFTCARSSVLWLWDKYLAPDQVIKNSKSLAKKQVRVHLISVFGQLTLVSWVSLLFPVITGHALELFISFWSTALPFWGLPYPWST